STTSTSTFSGTSASFKCVRALARADSPESRWFADQVGRLADAARQRGAQLGVVLVPFRWQLADPSDLTKSAAATISKLCARHGLPFLDTTEALSRGGPARVMFFDTFHLTPRGHAAVADALRGWLDQHPELLD
ncbi:MAG: SGNH/GDSL hydrolase family protein, partial [Phycisphaerae bacterium]